ncbi:hypothetical protein ACHAXT_004823 [Thalassiosira profunda]
MAAARATSPLGRVCGESLWPAKNVSNSSNVASAESLASTNDVINSSSVASAKSMMGADTATTRAPTKLVDRDQHTQCLFLSH